MKRDIDIPPHKAMLVLCTIALFLLVQAAGWTLPLRVAAMAIPVAFAL
jgi:hypothetical protein